MLWRISSTESLGSLQSFGLTSNNAMILSEAGFKIICRNQSHDQILRLQQQYIKLHHLFTKLYFILFINSGVCDYVCEKFKIYQNFARFYNLFQHSFASIDDSAILSSLKPSSMTDLSNTIMYELRQVLPKISPSQQRNLGKVYKIKIQTSI